ncbi:MAG: prepilin-type N-terminal cleavage/methylation domain-containing protein [Candidatus Saccharimonadales bacterium]
MRNLSNDGFTIIEIILVIGIITIMTAVAAPFYLSLSNSNELDAATNLLAQDLYQAQTYSRNQAQDAQWGVSVNGQVITLFSGSSYAARNPANDVVYTVPKAVKLSGSSQVVYSKLYGLPQATGSFSLVGGGKTSNVVVNNKGMVEY